MQVHEFIRNLDANQNSRLCFQLPSGELIPAHFHITEVGRLQRTFIDCGGEHRETTSCLLQVWTANDFDHRLDAAKLSGIMKLAAPVLKSDQLPVEVEYGIEAAAQYAVSGVEVGANDLLFRLEGKKTNCLALERCRLPLCTEGGCC